MARTKKGMTAVAATGGPVPIRSRVAGEACLSIRVVDRRYTAQQVIDGLNSGELKYASGLIRRAAEVIAKYEILSVDDYLESFQLAS